MVSKGRITSLVLGLATATVAMALTGGNVVEAKDLYGDYTLTNDMTEQIMIVAHKDVVLNLNGHNITTTGEDAIVVEKGANLTVVGDGVVEAEGVGAAPLYNNDGVVVLNGGTYLKDESKGTFYSILNQGQLTINDGVAVQMNNTAISSLIASGGGIRSNGGQAGYITINGGDFYGGVVNLKNDEGGQAVINGGNFIGGTAGTIQNWHIMEINGGNYALLESASERGIVTNGSDSTVVHPAKGLLTINGGTFTGTYLFEGYSAGCPVVTPATITGGIFNVDKMIVPGTEFGDAIKETVVTGGTFNNDIVEPADGYAKYTLPDGTVVIDEAVEFDASETTISIKVGEVVDLGLPIQVIRYGQFTVDGDVITIDGNTLSAIKAGKATLTIELNGAVKSYAVTVLADDSTDESNEPTDDVPTPSETTDKSSDDQLAIAGPNTGVVAGNQAETRSGSALTAVMAILVMLASMIGVRLSTKED